MEKIVVIFASLLLLTGVVSCSAQAAQATETSTETTVETGASTATESIVE